MLTLESDRIARLHGFVRPDLFELFGPSFMIAGQMCCGVLKNDLVVRIEPAEFDTLVAQPHDRWDSEPARTPLSCRDVIP
jgi:hypothetical protein